MHKNRKRHKSKTIEGEKELKDKHAPPLPFKPKRNYDLNSESRKKAIEEIMAKPGRLSLDDAKVLMESMSIKLEILKHVLDNFYYTRGITPETLSNYFSNPSNFSQREWAVIQAKQKTFYDALNKIRSGEEGAKLAATSNTLSSNQQVQKGKTSKRPRKRFPGQRQGWLPMR